MTAARSRGVPVAGGGELHSGTEETTTSRAAGRAGRPGHRQQPVRLHRAAPAGRTATTATTPPPVAAAPEPAAEPSAADTAGPAARGLLGCLTGPAGVPGLPDPKTLLGLLGAWHGRGVQVGFPELTARRP
ncbi:hypothetical protein [Streptomyces sp. NBC_01408]|uniref:hypothetical protein n=1 Tax=Streptomyces sp. NBC_01408 TaxID=2903855 RepID=UPI0022524BF6|nr:hypothetical protein [Streptomyces sp. NBC_01408]MCX4696867.1 hypothetical protein [Streptomyces sp. NBC_01408]